MIFPMYEKGLKYSNHKLSYVTEEYSHVPEINFSTKEQQKYIKCTRKEILNFAPGLSLKYVNAKQILTDFEKGVRGIDDGGGLKIYGI